MSLDLEHSALRFNAFLSPSIMIMIATTTVYTVLQEKVIHRAVYMAKGTILRAPSAGRSPLCWLKSTAKVPQSTVRKSIQIFSFIYGSQSRKSAP